MRTAVKLVISLNDAQAVLTRVSSAEPRQFMLRPEAWGNGVRVVAFNQEAGAVVFVALPCTDHALLEAAATAVLKLASKFILIDGRHVDGIPRCP